MSWSIGYDSTWKRDIGYAVPAICDHPGCNKVIDRGLSHVCGSEPRGGDRGCGLYFCSEHLNFTATLGELCDRCYPRVKKPFCAKPDHPEWIKFKLTDYSWKDWRMQNEREASALLLKLCVADMLEVMPKPILLAGHNELQIHAFRTNYRKELNLTKLTEIKRVSREHDLQGWGCKVLLLLPGWQESDVHGEIRQGLRWWEARGNLTREISEEEVRRISTDNNQPEQPC